MSIYIVVTKDDGELYEYEYGNLKHAIEHFSNESDATLYEYRDGKYHFVDAKME